MNKMSDLLVTYHGTIQKIVLNRPHKKNAINSEMYVNVTNLLKSSATDPNVNITVITGAGDCFSSGNDRSNYTNSEFNETTIKKASISLQAFVKSFIDYPKLLIGIINGPAIGIAATVLGLFDVLYASEKATFHTPFSQLGISPEGCATYTFPKIFGPSVSNEMLCLNRKLTAQEAKTYGFVSEVYSDSEIESVLWPKILKMSDLPVQSLIAAKQLVREPLLQDLRETNVKECTRLEERWQSEDFFNALMKSLQQSKKNKSKL